MKAMGAPPVSEENDELFQGKLWELSRFPDYADSLARPGADMPHGLAFSRVSTAIKRSPAFWAKLGSHPYWPARVSDLINSGLIFDSVRPFHQPSSVIELFEPF